MLQQLAVLIFCIEKKYNCVLISHKATPLQWLSHVVWMCFEEVC